ncbi:hypothetical protein [Curtobacterium sp. MCBD17_030]|uniref:hypothetical protein n=1 Tax=Curtobacterium sp. MCBD17_030 TaxID=2175649 RepID=UPI000D9ADF35|nr:hypothetical protein [Curtobacterium sp. MCBD17_030]PYY32346.1 hypothetical protein DEI89_13000 [Curtobacterium sp. MCBD17_030]
MVKRFSVGKSSYGDLRGIEQYVMSARIALQVLSVIVDFNAWQKQRGAVGSLSVNEGMRSRARQTYLWVNRLILAVVVAMPFTSRHDEVLHGNAIDFGITMPDGSNRALTPVEFAKLHELVEARGGTHTGINFGEQWHHEMATRAERLPPYPNAAQLAAGTAATPPPAKNTIPTIRKDDDMTAAVKIKETGARFQVGFGTLTYSSSTKDADLLRKVFSATDELHELSLADAKVLFAQCDIPTAYTDAKALLAAQPNGRWSLQALAVQELRAFIKKGGK